MAQNPAPEAPPAAEVAGPMKGLQIGRIVFCRDQLGTVRAGIVSEVIDPVEGLVNVIEFGRFVGEEAAVLSVRYRHSPDGQGNGRWWWPPKS